MDPLSTVAGVLGIASTAIQSVNTLVHEINAIRDAPDVIADLRDELAAVEAVLVALDNAHKDSQLENLTPDVKTALQLAITNCQKACDKFRTKLARWTKHSGDTIHWWDRVRVGLFAEATVEALSEQLNRCKSTINTAVSTTTLISAATFSSTADVMQRDLRSKEIEISQEMIEIDEQNAIAGMALQKVTDEQPLDDHQGHAEVIEQLQDQRAALDDSRKLLENLLAEAHQVRTGQKITRVDMRDGGRLLVGLINCDDGNNDIRQEIHDVKATNHGRGVVGIVKGVDVNAFLND